MKFIQMTHPTQKEVCYW